MKSSSTFTPVHLLVALGVVLIWGLNFVAMKLALREFTPFQLGAARYVFAAFPLLLFVRPPKLRWPWVVAAGMTQFGQFAFLFVALKMGMTSALASVLMQTQVFFTTLLGLLMLGERLNRPLRIGLLLAAGSLICFSMNFISGEHAAGITGLSLGLNLIAASMWATYNILARRAQARRPDYDALQLLVWMSLVPILPFMALSWWSDPVATRWTWTHASLTSWLAVAYLGWFATVAAFASWTWLLKQHAANKVAPFSLGVPVIGLMAGMVLLDESVSFWQWAGSGCVFVALVVVMLGPRMAQWLRSRAQCAVARLPHR